jgi:iron complex outermembrane receptor protein
MLQMRAWGAVIGMALGALPLAAAAQTQPVEDLMKIPIEQLMNIEVTSPSKRPQKLSDTASAIFVITQEDIRRSGATSIPEALRMVPGLQVARINSNSWAITSRGFASRFANKLLVLIDGRTIYTPLFSGVFWDRQDTLLEDVERIEVIRGPGAALWGANAVDGVINVITKNSRDTQGGLLNAGAGTYERGFGSVRYGGTLDPTTTYRLYAKYFNRDESITGTGAPGHDAWQYGRAGFRADGQPSTEDDWTLDGDFYIGRVGETFLTPTLTAPFIQAQSATSPTGGGHLLGRWSHAFNDASEISVQAYYDRSDFSDPRLSETRDTGDLEIEHRLRIGTTHEIVWGGGYRFTHDDIVNGSSITITPSHSAFHLANAFGQDTITLIDNTLFFTAGSKFEYNTFTGFEVQPDARLLWTPSPTQSVWGAVSRAVRTPSRAEDDISLLTTVVPPFSPGNPTPFPAAVVTNGSHSLKSEELIAYELGYRFQPTRQLSLDLAAFYNDYSRLVSVEPGPTVFDPGPPPHLVSILNLTNTLHGQTYGFEAAATWQANSWWRLQPSYTLLQMRLHRDSGSRAPASIESPQRQSPRNQFGLRSLMDLGSEVTFDTALRYVDSLPALGVPSYAELTARIAWRPMPNLELSLTGENLIHASHQEFGSETLPTVPTRVQRGVYAKVSVKF